MNLWSKLTALFRRRKLDADMAEEMRLHLERRTEENVADGMSREDAHYAALRKFGGTEQAKEVAREQRAFVWLEQTLQDLRYAVRQLTRAKGFTAVVVITLALGIGATTTIYSVVDAVLLNPVPGPDSDRLVQIGQTVPWPNHTEGRPVGVSWPVVQALAATPDLFDTLAWSDSLQLDLKGAEFSAKVSGSQVSANFFSVMSSRPSLGRNFTSNEGVSIENGLPLKDTSIVISHRWWQSHFAGDPHVLGRTVELSGHAFTVIGVMPESFQFPSADNLFWLPAEPARPQGLGGSNPRAIGRLKAGITPEQTEAILGVVRQRLIEDHPAGDRSYGDYWLTNGSLRLWCLPLREAMQNQTYTNRYDAVRRTLFGFLTAIGFVLAIVCANVANLTLARAERRQHEFALRAALGAGRGRLIRQLLAENLLLAVLGGTAGLIVTAWGMTLLAALSTMPRLRPIEVDGRVLAVSLAISLLTGLIFGLAPAWRIGRRRAAGTLRLATPGATMGSSQSRTRGALVVAEVALATVLLMGAGLTIRSVVQLLRVEPGFDPANLIFLQLDLTGRESFRPEIVRNTLAARAQEQLAALPGVSAVGIFKDARGEEKIEIEGRPDPVMAVLAQSGVGAADFFRAARIPLVNGRYFEASDIAPNADKVVINETLAHRCWPGENPVGKTFRALDRPGAPTYEVIGVAGDARLYLLNVEPGAVFYRPIEQLTGAGGGSSETLVVRAASDPATLIPLLRRELKAVNSDMRMPTIFPLWQRLYDGSQPQRTYRNYLAGFAGIGLSLAALGVYGVLSYSVAQRTKEIGIRLAIGADRRHVIRMIMSEGARLVVPGLVAGLVAAYWLTQLLQKQLYGIGPRDPLVIFIVVGVLGGIALLACWLPARRAANVDPMVALRAE